MTIDVNGVTLYYEVWGEGRPLIMVHGNGEDHSIFYEAAEILSQHFTCYLIDSRGHGQSSPVDRLDYRDMAGDIIDLVWALNLEGAVYYGFSDGGIIGLIAAIFEPELFDTLIVSGANLNPRGVRAGFFWSLKRETRTNRDPKLLLMLYQPHISRDDLSRIRARTLVLAGEHDLIREKHTKQIARWIPGAELWILPDEDHGSYITHSPKIAELILDFTNED